MIHIQKSLAEYPAGAFDLEAPGLFWKREPDDHLLHSLEVNGQCMPVLAAVDRDGGICLVAGRQRVRALACLGRPVVTCCVQAATPWERGVMFLESNRGQAMDDSMLVQAVRYFSGCREELELIAPYLGLQSRSKQWQVLMQWLALPQVWDDFLEKGHLPLVLARLLTRFRPAGLCALEPFFQDLSWSKNNAVHCVTWLWEASRSRGCTPEELLAEQGLAAILELNLSPRDRMMRLLESLREARYPRLVALEKGFRSRAARVVADSHWRLVQPDHFETGAVEFLARVTTRAELKTRTQELAEIARDAVWDDLEQAGSES